MVTATLSGQVNPSFPLGEKKKTTKLRQQNQVTERIQVATEDLDQKLSSGHAERIYSDYVQHSNAVDVVVLQKHLPLVPHVGSIFLSQVDWCEPKMHGPVIKINSTSSFSSHALTQ